VELAAAGAAHSGGVIAPAISAVFTIDYVAKQLGKDEDWLHELAIDMFPEDGCLWIYGVGEDGIAHLRQIIADAKAAGRAPPRVNPTK
jgi:hypothetical protein